MTQSFRDRQQAGELLARQLEDYAGNPDAVVFALPRGGVPVGYAIAEHLGLQLDVLLARKLGIPGNEELAMGAISGDGVCVLRPEIIAALDIPPEAIEAVAQRELREMKRRERAYRSGRPPARIEGHIAIVVDDGLATGATMQAAVRALRHAHPARIVVAVPVAAPESLAELQTEVDEVVCLAAPEWFSSVGRWYADFRQVSDAEVKHLLAEAEQWHIPKEEESHPLPQRNHTQPPSEPWQVER